MRRNPLKCLLLNFCIFPHTRTAAKCAQFQLKCPRGTGDEAQGEQSPARNETLAYYYADLHTMHKNKKAHLPHG